MSAFDLKSMVLTIRLPPFLFEELSQHLSTLFQGQSLTKQLLAAMDQEIQRWFQKKVNEYEQSL